MTSAHWLSITPLQNALQRKSYIGGAFAFLLFIFQAALADSPWPSFKATALDGDVVASDRLIGQPTLLIITPSRHAAESTRRWVNALRDELNPENYRVRDVLAVNLPFFMSEEDAIGRAKEAIPERFHDQTWILNSDVLENAFGIPSDSKIASVVVLDSAGQVVARVHGTLNESRLKTIVSAAKSLR